ncbi:type IV secretion protein Rhs [Rathayibacter toxicus]|uniref:DUF6531 domain-containing protein n=1 Tax=Rathayibacter toxicus TaxID=145458 RepID=UPI000CE7B0ED|nr:DUF6531 domain-containing protein [Rathayibacter toxicus]PPI48668.1 type IV secretion protein Rhs [Rathayibacter toxicus]
MDLGAIEEDVPFDNGTAEKLIAEFNAAAATLEGQGVSRSTAVTSALTEFRGRFAELFQSNARIAAQDSTELTERLRQVATAAGRLREEAQKEQERRRIAREWKHKHDNKNFFEKAGEALFGEEHPPVGPAAQPLSLPVEAGSTGSRETPAPSGTGFGSGTSSARPADLRSFATTTVALNDDLKDKPTTLRGLLADFAANCRWGYLSADGVVAGLEQWLTANAHDATWATTLANAFAAAGGEGVVSRVADSALAVALTSAGASLRRQDLTIDPPQAFGAPPTTGYADDPVNTATGNFLEAEVDLGFSGGCASLEFSRSYNSLDDRSAAFGRGWSSIADERLRLADDGATWVLRDGREIFFPREGDGWARAVGENCWLVSEGEHLVVSGNDGSRREFSSSGRWLSASTGPGTRVWADYDVQERLVRLRHERGRWIDIEWAQDRIVVVTASDGRRMEYEYEHDRLVAATGPLGSRRYGWNEDGLLASVTDVGGVVEVANTYDARRRVVTQRSPFGRVTRYAYLPGRTTVVSDEDGTRSNTWIADARGRLVGVIDSHGRRQSMSFDARGNLLSVTERNGAVTAHAYDERGRRVRTVTESGADITYGYDSHDRVTTVVAEAGAVTSYEYPDDDSRNPCVLSDPEGGRTTLIWSAGLLTEAIDPVGVAVRFHYDEHGELIATTNAEGQTARLERDAAGRVTAAVSPSGARTQLRYDDAGRLVSHRDALGATWRYEHDSGSRVSAIIDPLGARTVMEHGEHGEVTRTIDPLGRAVTRLFDDLGNVEAAILPDGSAWRFAHDALSRLTAITDPTGEVWRREYDATGELAALIDPTGVRCSLSAQARRVTVNDGVASARVECDPLGRPTSVESPDGSTSVTVYDRCGRPVELLDGEGSLTVLRRDAAGRVVEHISPTGAVTRYEYDRCGRPQAVVDPSGARTTIEYDADGRPVRQVAANGEVEWTEYDVVGRVTAQHTPGRGTARYRYDALGRVVFSRDSWYGTRRFRYDAAGQLVEAVNGLGGVTRYEYDERGRTTAVIDPLGGVNRRAYDATDRAVAVTDPLGRTTTAGYDAAGRPLWQQDPDGHRAQWRYDGSGREASSWVDGRCVSEIDRDVRGRRVVVTDHSAAEGPVAHTLVWNRRGQLVGRTRGGRGVAWEYDAGGARVAMVDPDGVRTVYERDALGRVVAVEHPLLGRAECEYDAAGRLVSSSAGGVVQRWEYRDGFPVVHEVVGSGVSVLDRDGEGRLVRVSGFEGVVEYGYDGACQLVESRGRVVSSWRYDVGGRVVSEMVAGRSVVNSYDVAGQLVRSVGGDGSVSEFVYDGLGRRVGVRGADGGERCFAWSGGGWLESVTDRGGDGSVSVTRLSVDVLGELASVDGVEVWWDSAAVVPAVVSVGGVSVVSAPGGVTGVGGRWLGSGWRGERGTGLWDPWGVVTVAAGGGGVPVGVSVTAGGGVAVAGVEWLGFRVYDPGTRGFLSVDPLEPVVGSGWVGNPYSYAGNDPLHAVDPWGLRPVTDEELRVYREGNNGVFAAQWDWSCKNWEYAAGVAMVGAGGFLMATGIGGPLGVMLIGAGVDTIIQKATSGKVEWGEVAVSGALGAFGGAGVAAKAGFTGMKAAVVAGAASGGVSGGVQNTYSYMTGPGPHDVGGALQSAAVGTASGALLGAGGGAAGQFASQKVMGALAHNPGAETMAMGRSMPQRVTPYALKNDYGYYKALPDPVFRKGEKVLGKKINEKANVWVNKKWIDYQMKQGKNLVDIGAPDELLRPQGLKPLDPSAYYSMELERVKGYPQYRQDPQPQWDLRNK